MEYLTEKLVKGAFPSPLEVTGVSYKTFKGWKVLGESVSVPSRGDWGVLHRVRPHLPTLQSVFPSPLEVTGVSYPISCIGSSRRTTRSSLTSQLELILIIP